MYLLDSNSHTDVTRRVPKMVPDFYYGDSFRMTEISQLTWDADTFFFNKTLRRSSNANGLTARSFRKILIMNKSVKQTQLKELRGRFYTNLLPPCVHSIVFPG